MAQVTSTELQSNLSEYRKLAQKEDVIVTERGKENVAIIGIDRYRSMLDAYNQINGTAKETFDNFRNAFLRHLQANSEVPTHFDRLVRSIDFLERVLTLNVISDQRFEIGGVVFEIDEGKVRPFGECPWLRGEDGKFTPSAFAFKATISIMVDLEGKSLNIWGKNPTFENIKNHNFIPAFLGFLGKDDKDYDKLAEWIKQMQGVNVTIMGFDMSDDLRASFHEIGVRILRENDRKINAIECDLDAFKEAIST